ncbi:unnamed protein product [Callosobruchus maculatus]|uniref:HMG box domain-containing protein n=1 Tax=Callosobruchus maculatus TaxID=64391 RepID=A0A653BRB5_CALMS|nr:unnamed protein product [Callosobruchus maculatus]
MSDKEKKRFHEMAETDKKRYDAEMQNYTPPKGEKQRGKKRKQMKDPDAPKRSLSAFFWFSNDERGKVKGENPEYSEMTAYKKKKNPALQQAAQPVPEDVDDDEEDVEDDDE